MVTIQEFEKQLQQRKRTIEIARRQLEAEKAKAPPQPTQAQLRAITSLAGRQRLLEQQRAVGAARAGILAEAERKIVAAKTEQERMEKEFAPIKQRFLSEKSYIEQFERGKALALADRPPIGLETEVERKGFRAGRAEFESFRERKKQLKVLGEVGITIKEFSAPDLDLSALTLPQLEKLEEAGLVEFKKERPIPSFLEGRTDITVVRRDPASDVPFIVIKKPGIKPGIKLPTKIPIEKPKGILEKAKGVLGKVELFLRGGREDRRNIFGLKEFQEFAIDPLAKPEILKGEKVSPFLIPFFVGAKATEQLRKFEEFKKFEKQVVDPIAKKLGVTGVSITASLAATLPVGFFFDPAISSAAAAKAARIKQKQVQLQKQITKTRFEGLGKQLDTVDELRNAFLFKREGNVFRVTTKTEKLDLFKEILIKSKKLKPSERLILQRELEKAWGKEEFRNVAREFARQEGITTIKTPGTSIKTTTTKDFMTLDLLIEVPKKLKGVAPLLASATVLESREFQKLFSITTPKEKVAEKPKTVVVTVPGVAVKPKIAERARLKITTIAIPKFVQPTVPKAITKIKVKPKPKPPRTRPGFPRLIKPKIIVPPLILVGKPEDRKVAIALAKKIIAYDVFLKKRGKFVKIANDLPINRAIRTGARITARDLGATFKIVADPKGKVTKKDIPKFTPSPRMFRDYRISKGKRIPMKNTWIERRKFRLDTPQEVLAIKAIRRLTSKMPKRKQRKSTKKSTKRKSTKRKTRKKKR